MNLKPDTERTSPHFEAKLRKVHQNSLNTFWIPKDSKIYDKYHEKSFRELNLIIMQVHNFTEKMIRRFNLRGKFMNISGKGQLTCHSETGCHRKTLIENTTLLNETVP